MNKKGQIGGGGLIYGVVIIIALLILGLAYGAISFSTNYFLDEINTDVQANIDDNNTKGVVSQMESSFPSMQESIFALIMFLLFAFSLYAAWMSDVNPLLFIIMLIVIIVLIVVAGMLSNFWDEFTNSSSTFTGFTVEFPFMNWVLDNYALVFGSLLFMMLATSFMKGRFG